MPRRAPPESATGPTTVDRVSDVAFLRPGGFRNTVLASGHVTDAPGRSSPRFPENAVRDVEQQVADLFERWDLNDSDLLICGGARGADIIAAEQARRRQTTVWVLLAHRAEVFEQTSVAGADPAWIDRYWRMLQRCPSWALDEDPHFRDEPRHDNDAYETANKWMVSIARRQGNGRPLHLVAVWDGQPAEGSGGTANMVEVVSAEGGIVVTIDPAR